MKSMIFAAGLGTRLQPMTEKMPKALIEIGGKTLIEIAIEKLITCGVSAIVVNVHHFADMIISFLNQPRFRELPIFISEEREMLLDTGGGLKKAIPYLIGNEPILIHNVDILSNLDLKELTSFHLKSNCLATLVIRSRNTQRYLMFDSDNNLAGWKNVKTGEQKIARPETYDNAQPYAFSGIQVISPRLLNLLGIEKRFSIMDTYLYLAATWDIKGFNDSASLWMDIGKPDQLKEAQKNFK